MSASVITGAVAATAGVAMALSPLLQAQRVRLIGDSAEVSTALYMVMTVNAFAWSAHGIAERDLVLIIPNATGLVVALLSLVVIRHYRPRLAMSTRT